MEAAKALKQRAIDLDAQRVRWTEEARIREKVEQHRRHIQIFRTNLLAEAAAARDGELLTQYVLRLKESLGRADTTLSEVAKEWLRFAEKIAAESDPLERRLTRLQTLTEVECYYGYFGRPFIAQPT